MKTAKEKFETLFNSSVSDTRRKWSEMARDYALTHHCVHSDTLYMQGMVTGLLFADVLDDDEYVEFNGMVDHAYDYGVGLIEQMTKRMKEGE